MVDELDPKNNQEQTDVVPVKPTGAPSDEEVSKAIAASRATSRDAVRALTLQIPQRLKDVESHLGEEFPVDLKVERRGESGHNVVFDTSALNKETRNDLVTELNASPIVKNAFKAANRRGSSLVVADADRILEIGEREIGKIEVLFENALAGKLQAAQPAIAPEQPAEKVEVVAAEPVAQPSRVSGAEISEPAVEPAAVPVDKTHAERVLVGGGDMGLLLQDKFGDSLNRDERSALEKLVEARTDVAHSEKLLVESQWRNAGRLAADLFDGMITANDALEAKITENVAKQAELKELKAAQVEDEKGKVRLEKTRAEKLDEPRVSEKIDVDLSFNIDKEIGKMKAEYATLGGLHTKVKDQLVLSSDISLKGFKLRLVSGGEENDSNKELVTRMVLSSDVLDDIYGTRTELTPEVAKHINDRIKAQISGVIEIPKRLEAGFDKVGVTTLLTGAANHIQHGGPAIVVSIQSKDKFDVENKIDETSSLKALAAGRIFLANAIAASIEEKVSLGSVSDKVASPKFARVLEKSFELARKNPGFPLKDLVLEPAIRGGFTEDINKGIAEYKSEIGMAKTALNKRKQEFYKVVSGEFNNAEVIGDKEKNTLADVKMDAGLVGIVEKLQVGQSGGLTKHIVLQKEIGSLLSAYDEKQQSKDSATAASGEKVDVVHQDNQWAALISASKNTYEKSKSGLKAFEKEYKVNSYLELMGEDRARADQLAKDVVLTKSIQETIRNFVEVKYEKEINGLSLAATAISGGLNSRRLNDRINGEFFDKMMDNVEKSVTKSVRDELLAKQANGGKDIESEKSDEIELKSRATAKEFVNTVKADKFLKKEIRKLGSVARSGEVEALWDVRVQEAKRDQILHTSQLMIKDVLSSDETATKLKITVKADVVKDGGVLPNDRGLALTALKLTKDINENLEKNSKYAAYKGVNVGVHIVAAGQGIGENNEPNKNPYIELVAAGKSHKTVGLARKLTAMVNLKQEDPAATTKLEGFDKFKEDTALNQIRLDDKLVRHPKRDDEKTTARYLAFRLDGEGKAKQDEQAQRIELRFANALGIEPGSKKENALDKEGNKSGFKHSSYQVDVVDGIAYVPMPASLTKPQFSKLMTNKDTDGLGRDGFKVDPTVLDSIYEHSRFTDANHNQRIPTSMPLNLAKATARVSMMDDVHGNSTPSISIEVPVIGQKGKNLAELLTVVEETKLMLSDDAFGKFSKEEKRNMQVRVMESINPKKPSVVLIDIPTTGDQKIRDRLIGIKGMIRDNKKRDVTPEKLVEEVKKGRTDWLKVTEDRNNALHAMGGLSGPTAAIGLTTAVGAAVAIALPAVTIAAAAPVIGMGLLAAVAGGAVMALAAIKNIDRFDNKKVAQSERNVVGLLQREPHGDAPAKLDEMLKSGFKTIKEAYKSSILAVEETDLSSKQIIGAGLALVGSAVVFSTMLPIVPILAVAASKVFAKIGGQGKKFKQEVDDIEEQRKPLKGDGVFTELAKSSRISDTSRIRGT